MEHQDTKQTSMSPRLKELNDIPYILMSYIEFMNGEGLTNEFIDIDNYYGYTGWLIRNKKFTGQPSEWTMTSRVNKY